MKATEVREKFLQFFQERGHTIIPSASLIPEHDPAVLFTTAGMHPLAPYLMGQPHPGGKRLTNVQKCLRTDDIEEVGDERHMTFFEMLGNWSLGDYWKKEAIEWSFEFLTSRSQLGLDPTRIYVTVFEGDSDAPCDEESIQIWRETFGKVNIQAELGKRIFTYPKKQNWWGPAGLTGPCGPDTEMFFDTLNESNPSMHQPNWQSENLCHPNCDCGRYVEIWNDVFMQYNKKADGSLEPLSQKNVDTGMGLERITAVLQGIPQANVYQTELFHPLVSSISSLASREDAKAIRVIADHVRAVAFLLSEGLVPSNTERGYVLRRLIRRVIRQGLYLGIKNSFMGALGKVVSDIYEPVYPEIFTARPTIVEELNKEEEKFRRTLEKGLAKLTEIISGIKEDVVPGEVVFDLYQSYGFPLELTQEELRRIAPQLKVDEEGFYRAFAKHQDISRASVQARFAGGLADHSEIVVKYHTATHLLHQALRDILGPLVFQKGSNLTAQRMRFDFSYPQKLTPEQIEQVELLVNQKIKENLPVVRSEMSIAEAKNLEALGLFEQKYGDIVSVYTIGNYSKEICGGPHVKSTREIGEIKIIKEEGVSSGIRRIRAVLI